MMRSKSLLLPLPYFGVACPGVRVRVRASAWLSEWAPSLSVPNSGEHDPWTRVRAQHSRRMVGRRAYGDKERSGIFVPLAPFLIPSRSSKDGREAKVIFVVSDRTGWTAEQADAARRQFQQCDRPRPINTHLFSGIDDMERLMKITKEATKEAALLLYKLADPAMAEAAKNACRLWGVPSAELRPIINCGLANAPGMVLDRCKRLGEGRRHGGVAAKMQRYLVFVQVPDIGFAGPEERDAWYRSFFSVDECRDLFSSDLTFGVLIWLTKEEFVASTKKEGFLGVIPNEKHCIM